jgi:hypothetical protein
VILALHSLWGGESAPIISMRGKRDIGHRLLVLDSGLLLIKDINLVDPASSHTLVSKIKPCMSKYKQLCTVKLRMAHYISYSLLDSTLLLG